MKAFYFSFGAIALVAASVFAEDKHPLRPRDLPAKTAATLDASTRWLVDGNFPSSCLTTAELQKALNVHTSSTLSVSSLVVGNVTLSGGGTGLVFSNSGSLSATTAYVMSIVGTTNQISATSSTGAITLSLPQDIHTGASPTFAGATIGSLNGVVKASSGTLSGSATTSDLTEGSNLYYTDARARLALSAGTGISYSNATGVITNGGVISLTGTTNQVTVSSTTGAITISLPQNIHTGASPTFLAMTATTFTGTSAFFTNVTASTLTIGSLGGVLKATSGFVSGSATTSDLTEGSNLYYTDARARLAISAGAGLSYSNATGVMTNTGVITLTGTAQQVYASASTGSITLSLSQNISDTSSPTFRSETLSWLNISQTASISGAPTAALTITGGAHSGFDAALFNDVHFNLARTVTFDNTDSLSTLQAAIRVSAPTYATSDVGGVNFATAGTFVVENWPGAGSNVTYDERAALWIADGGAIIESSTSDIKLPLMVRSATNTCNIRLECAGPDWTVGTATASLNNSHLRFSSSSIEALRMSTTGRVGIRMSGTTDPSALLHLSAGTTTAGFAPLKFTSGSLMSTAEAGAVEFLTDDFYATITTSAARKPIVLADSALTLGRVPFTTTNGRLIDSSGLTWNGSTFSIAGAITTSTGTFSAITVNGASTLNGALTMTGTINLATGSTSQVPIMFNSASALTTTPAAGYFEYASDKYYGTITTGTSRKEFTLNDAALTAGRIPFATTNGRLTDSSALTWTGSVLGVTGVFNVSSNILCNGNITTTFGSGTFGGQLNIGASGSQAIVSASQVNLFNSPNSAHVYLGRTTTTNSGHIQFFTAGNATPKWDFGLQGVGQSGGDSTNDLRVIDIDLVERLRFVLLSQKSNVFNDGSADIDFRVESDNDANAIMVDASVDMVGFRQGTPTSTVHVGGSLALAYVAKTADYTLTATDYTVNVTANSPTITLPTAVGITGRVYVIKNTGLGVVTLATTSSQTIDGAAPGTVIAGGVSVLQSDGANWIKIN